MFNLDYQWLMDLCLNVFLLKCVFILVHIGNSLIIIIIVFLTCHTQAYVN